MKIQINKNFNDKIYTPNEIVVKCVDYLSKNYLSYTDILLDPALGLGGFYKELVERNFMVEWCEIEKGRDFFEYKGKVDWIITNPPFSIMTEWLEQCVKVSEKGFALLIPINKVFISNKRLDIIKDFSIEILRFKTPKSWSINFPIALMIFKKEKDK